MLKLWRRLSSKEFQDMFNKGTFLSGKYLCINIKQNGGPSVGFTLKKLKRTAVERNWMRRRIKEAFLKIQEFIPESFQLIIIGFPKAKNASIEELSNEIYQLVYLYMRKKRKNENNANSY